MNVPASKFIETSFHHSYSVDQQNEFTLDVDLKPACGWDYCSFRRIWVWEDDVAPLYRWATTGSSREAKYRR